MPQLVAWREERKKTWSEITAQRDEERPVGSSRGIRTESRRKEEPKWRKPGLCRQFLMRLALELQCLYKVDLKKRFKEQRAVYQDPLAVIGFKDGQQISVQVPNL